MTGRASLVGPAGPHAAAGWRVADESPALAAGAVHVWRVRLDRAPAPSDWAVLSADERARAERFFQEVHRRRFVVAHGALRRILASYVGATPDALGFARGAHGKPSLAGPPACLDAGVEFNLSHSDELALVAVARGPVGVDVERWQADIEHVELAERFFSPAERDALRALREPPHVVAGFFAAWSRKEAYLKATGLGITRGLHHFDVTLHPDEPARLLADRHDPSATSRWRMTSFDVAVDYSAALVAAAPLDELTLLEAPAVR